VEGGRREGGFHGVGESNGKKGKGDLNRSRATNPLEGERSPKGGRTFALVRRRECGMGTNVRHCAPGEGANDRPRMCFLSVFSTIEEVSANDRLVMDESSLPQCV
jgi:hypothetical protein